MARRAVLASSRGSYCWQDPPIGYPSENSLNERPRGNLLPHAGFDLSIAGDVLKRLWKWLSIPDTEAPIDSLGWTT